MSEFYSDGQVTLYHGEARDVLTQLPAESVQCVVTSPPYWGLRDYGTATWDGGDAECGHVAPLGGGSAKGSTLVGTGNREGYSADGQFRRECGKCGARRIDRQLGLEPTPEAYVDAMVDVFRHVRRVLRDDGTLWLNIGDTYAAQRGGSAMPAETLAGGVSGHGDKVAKRGRESEYLAHRNAASYGLKHKDLVGIPWLLAFALRQPYYTGRIKAESDRIWLSALMDGEGTMTVLSTTSPHGSGNSYPPIAQVRMTSEPVVQKAGSLVGVSSPAQYPPSLRGKRAVYQWRLSGRRAADVAGELFPYLIEKRKQALILWNHQAVRDSYETKRGVSIPVAAVEKQRACRELIQRLNHGEHVDIPSWMVTPPSFTEPGWYLRQDLIWSKPNPMPESVRDRCTKAHEYLFLLSKSERYWYDQEAIAEPFADDRMGNPKGGGQYAQQAYTYAGPHAQSGLQRGEWNVDGERTTRNKRSVWHIATAPFPEAHFATFPPALVEPCILAGSREGDVVLDPFIGSGTTAMVARQLGRRAIGIDLNSEYLAMARRRVGEQLALLGDAR